MKKLYLWAREKVHSPYALPFFALLVAVEGVLFMPVNTLLMIYGIEWPQRVWTYAVVAFLSSLVGAALAYMLGMALPSLGAEEILYWFFSPTSLKDFGASYVKNEIPITFLYSLLPLPFKVVTLSAGFFRLPFIPFILSVAAARFIRFFGIALALHLWGKRIQKIVDRHFSLFVGLTVVLLLAMLWFSYKH